MLFNLSKNVFTVLTIMLMPLLANAERISQAPFELYEEKGGLVMKSHDGRFEIDVKRIKDKYTGIDITTLESLKYAKTKIDMGKVLKNSDKSLNEIKTYSTSKDKSGIILVIDPFQTESFELVKKLIKKYDSRAFDYTIVLLPTTADDPQRLAPLYCSLRANGHSSLVRYASGEVFDQKCKDVQNFVRGMLAALNFTGGTVPFIIDEDNNAYYSDRLELFDLGS